MPLVVNSGDTSVYESPTPDYGDKSVMKDNLIPIVMYYVKSGDKTYQQLISYYNPTYSLNNAFQWSKNADCEINYKNNPFCGNIKSVLLTQAEALIYENSTKKWFYVPSISLWADRKNWVDITEMAKVTGQLGSVERLRKKARELGYEFDDKGRLIKKAEATSEKTKWIPFIKERQRKATWQSPLALFIPEWFPALVRTREETEEERKRRIKFFLICLGVGMVAFGRKRRIARRTARRTGRRTARRTSRRVTRRNIAYE